MAKKLNELSIQELQSYYELAQTRFEQMVKMFKINTNGLNMPGEDRKMTQFQHIVDRIVREIERRLTEDIDLS